MISVALDPRLRFRLVADLEDGAKSKGSLNAPDVVFAPVPLCWFLLSNWDAVPINPHDRHSIHIVLFKLDLEGAVVSLGPLRESPLLDDRRRLIEFDILAAYIASEQLKLATRLCAFKDLWWRSRECCYPLRVGKGIIKLLSSGAKLLLISETSHVD